MSKTLVSTIPLVFIDSNVLYPVSLGDLVLSSVDDGLLDVCVSDNLLIEIERVSVFAVEGVGLAEKSNEADRWIPATARYVKLITYLFF